MALLDRGDVLIRYEERGGGFPLLLLAPGGMRSAIEAWQRAAVDPLLAYGDDFRLIAMDQRNAGESSGPLAVEDPWGAYADDQLRLLDHLGIERCHVFGCCVGCSLTLKLCERAPERIVSAVLEQPIGIDGGNRQLFDELWRDWGRELAAARPDVDESALEAFGAAMWSGDFVLSVPREFVRSCRTPLLVMPGVDPYHPGPIGREVAALAPDAQVVEPWKDPPERITEATERARAFLLAHTP